MIEIMDLAERFEKLEYKVAIQFKDLKEALRSMASKLDSIELALR